jgi:DNA-binding NarL/FixJ family response regulator
MLAHPNQHQPEESTITSCGQVTKGKRMLKVVIADDSALVRERLATLISEIKAVELVCQASDAREALEDIRRLRPDVVVLDIRMAEGNGLRVLEAIKADAVAPVVIMLTAFPYPQYRRKCLEMGAEYFFDKTNEFDCVADVLRQLRDKAAGRCAASSEPRLP